MKLGIVNQESWMFFDTIRETVAAAHPFDVFEPAEWNVPVWQAKMRHRMLRRSLKRFLQAHDVVYFEWSSALLMEASHLWQVGDAAIVARLHRYELYQWAERVKWQNVRYVLPSAPAIGRKLAERAQIDPQRIVWIPPVQITPERLVQHEGPVRGNIGILGALRPRKRVYELILAFSSLCEQYPGPLRLHVAGAARDDFKAYVEALHALVERLQLTDRVLFDGFVDRWQWLPEMDIVVSNSYSEGMQVAPLEAAASGCYCLTHWWDGAEDFFPPEQRFVTEEAFVEQALRYLCAGEEAQQQMRQPFQRFVAEQCGNSGDRVIEILERAAAEPA